ncbi:hypothetical protein FRC96_04350 [Lujinxingia vulgaris]|uniref:Uncharacterized protein n=1 Tax=Lujinxingia vulgaris TaxID=2600176 RepID=A0A5C6XKD1_9DELT|nr:hypothetical protein [Lujinxingia vulgaris]TXD41225.1 hypothetical protein FRC96_04350 [Lujinxingia vulgaris]
MRLPSLALLITILTACSTPTPTDPPAQPETPATPAPADLTLPTPQPPPPTTNPGEDRIPPAPAPPDAHTTPETVDEPAPSDAPTTEPHPTRCQTSNDCVAINLTRACCSACTDVAFHRDFIPHLRAYCDANPELRSQCPALGCAYEPATAACIKGHCQAITTDASIFGM